MKYNFCPNCGSKLEEHFRFCPMCGIEIGRMESAPLPEPSRPYADREYGYSRPQSTLDRAKDLFRDKDYPMALSYLLEYADSDDKEILYMIGYCLYMTKKFDPNCEKFLKLAADQGHPYAQATLGELYCALADDCNNEIAERGYDPYSEVTRDRYMEIKAKCEKYYELALEYLNLAKSNGVR